MGVAIGMDKHPAGAFSADSVEYALPAWYGETGHFMTTKFFGMKINRYMHDHGISESTLAKVAAKAFRHGEKNPNAFRRKPLTEEQILESPRSEEHTSELQSLMRISYAVFCLKKKIRH